MKESLFSNQGSQLVQKGISIGWMQINSIKTTSAAKKLKLHAKVIYQMQKMMAR